MTLVSCVADGASGNLLHMTDWFYTLIPRHSGTMVARRARSSGDALVGMTRSVRLPEAGEGSAVGSRHDVRGGVRRDLSSLAVFMALGQT